MVGMDFDFARYIALRRGMVEQRARDGAAYAYAGERKVRRTLSSARPVTMAIEATTRMWKGPAKRELLASSTKATDQQHPRVHRALLAACHALGVAPPPVHIAADFPVASTTLGTDEDPVIVLRAAEVARLDDAELTALCGHELGHIQNNHVVFTTSLHYLRHRAVFFVRWIVQPAILALQAWSRRAEVSCDRAALVAARDERATLSMIVRCALGEVDVAEILAKASDPKGVGRYAELFRSHPDVGKRIAALRLFADGALYKKLLGQDPAGAASADDIDAKVGEIVSVL